MKIEVIKNNKILVNSSKENFEIHPLWLRERAKTEKLVDKHNDQRLYDPSQLDENLKIKKEGIKRKLVGIEILGDPISKVVPPQYTPGYFVRDHWPVFDEKKEIGYVTYKCFSLTLVNNTLM